MKPDKLRTFPVKFRCMFCSDIHEVRLRDFIAVIAVFATLLIAVVIKYSL